MTWLEFLVILLLVGIMFFLIYYYFRGAKGNIELRRPMESRVDEYLDRRFESIIEEYSLVRTPRLQGFRQLNEPLLAENEGRAQALKKAEEELNTTLDDLGKRLEALEHEMAVPR
jgi:hypothetical protein